MKLLDIIASFIFTVSLLIATIGLTSSNRFKNGWKYALYLQTIIGILGISIIALYVCFALEARF